jgi:hypothetical protein
LLRSPSILVTSVAAIGGLSAIGAGPSSDPAGEHEAMGHRGAAPVVAAHEELFAEVGAAATTPRIVLDAVDPVRPVDVDSLNLLGTGQELSSLAVEGVGETSASSSRFDVLDPAEFAALDSDEVADGEEVADGDDAVDDASALVYEAADGERIDPERIRVWLAGRNYPLADYADELVAAGIEHGVDPRLIVGIAVIESSGGKRLPPSTHNAWGWSGNGPHGLRSWPSWPEAIDGFTEGLARVYDTDNVDERMARKYVPPNWEKWLRTVRWVIDDI